MSWSPNNDDLGHHIVCANAEDSAGSAEFFCDLMNRFKKKEKRAKNNPPQNITKTQTKKQTKKNER